MTSNTSEGFVLAFHSVPASVEPGVEAFWSALALALRANGQTLVLISTVPLQDPQLAVIVIPYVLTEFTLDPDAAATTPDADLANEIGAWYGCLPADAQVAAQAAWALFQDMFDSFEPVAAIGWQSMHPASRLFRRLARQRDIPNWMAERGWIRGTLMVDLCDNNFLSEISLSVPLKRIADGYQYDREGFKTHVKRLTAGNNRSRYASPDFEAREAFRRRLGIASGAQVFVLMTHGEPHLNALSRDRIRINHRTSREVLQCDVEDIAQALSQQGKWLLVQEHPFNDASGATLKLPDLPTVLRVKESVDTLLDGADCMLFTLSTIQFDAALAGKPFGLLSKSLLALPGGPPQLAEHEFVEAFLADIEDAAAWPARQAVLDRRLAFLLDHVLLPIDDAAARSEAAQRLAAHLGELAGYVPSDLDLRIDRFIARWQGAEVQQD